MPESKLIAEFNSCKCGCTETVTRKAVQPYIDNGKIDKEAPVACRRVQIPLVQPSQMALTCPVLSLSFDHCLECGEERLVRAEVVNAPITFQQSKPGQGSGQGFGLPPGFGRG